MEKYVGIDCSSKAVHIVVLDGKEQLIDKYKWESKLKTADARFLDIVDQLYEGLANFKDAKLVCVEDTIYIQNPLSTRTITAIVYWKYLCNQIRYYRYFYFSMVTFFYHYHHTN